MLTRGLPWPRWFPRLARLWPWGRSLTFPPIDIPAAWRAAILGLGREGMLPWVFLKRPQPLRKWSSAPCRRTFVGICCRRALF
jgi:hypothetical protein